MASFDKTSQRKECVLLTGATGYVGGRLLRALEARGGAVRCLVRRPEALEGRVGPFTEIIAGDFRSAELPVGAFQQVDAAYYLIHSLGTAQNFEDLERETATRFADACRRGGVGRIIYLGGLNDPGAAEASAHLRSRNAVGEILRQSGLPVIEFHASIIIGSGSLSFELIRALVERLPVMVTPRWVSTLAQPIGIEDVVSYLISALDLPLPASRDFQIGGPDQVSYGDLMQEYARQRGLHRFMIPVPFLTPRLSSLWLGLVTPIYARVGRKLIDGLRVPSIVQNSEALATFALRPRGFREALARALHNEDADCAITHWADAVSSSGEERTWGGVRFGNRLVDTRSRVVAAAPEAVFKIVQAIGGKTGWYFSNVLWQIRGALDLLVGGAGLRRGRRHPRELYVGGSLDFWRVQAYEPPHKLRLQAEMKLPGRAWLEFVVARNASGGTLLTQTAIFDPLGLGGLLYWYALYPIHRLIFAGMLRNMARAAATGETS